MSFTITEWAIVALVFVGGWLLGLASHPGGRKWRERYATEREAHAAARKDADARVAAAKAEADARADAAETRYRELERDHARLVAAAPVTASTVQTVPEGATVIAPRPVAAQTVVTPAAPVTEPRHF